MIELTDWAVEVLARSADAATRLNPDASLRLTVRNGALEPMLTDAFSEGDVEVRVGERVVFVASDVAGLVDVEAPHDRLVLKPPGAVPNERPDV